MAEEIVFSGRLRPGDGVRAHVFDLQAMGLTEWAGVRAEAVPYQAGQPPYDYTDAELDGLRAVFSVQHADDQGGPWDSTTNPPVDGHEFVGAGQVVLGPRTYKRYVRTTFQANSDIRFTLARTIPT